MSKIGRDRVALDTNDFIFGIRRDASYPACAGLLRDQIDLVSLFVPLRVQIELQGAKKGDALICAELDAAGVRWLVSENRHFLHEIPDLPFAVVSAERALALLAEE